MECYDTDMISVQTWCAADMMINMEIEICNPNSNFTQSGLVVFYSISTLMGYLMPNPVYTHIIYIYDLKSK